MTLYLVVIVTDSRQNCLRDIQLQLLKTAGADENLSWKNSSKTLP